MIPIRLLINNKTHQPVVVQTKWLVSDKANNDEQKWIIILKSSFGENDEIEKLIITQKNQFPFKRWLFIIFFTLLSK